jgi:hypothetical protein
VSRQYNGLRARAIAIVAFLCKMLTSSVRVNMRTQLMIMSKCACRKDWSRRCACGTEHARDVTVVYRPQRSLSKTCQGLRRSHAVSSGSLDR